MFEKKKVVVVSCPGCNAQFTAIELEFLDDEVLSDIFEYAQKGCKVNVLESKDVSINLCQCHEKERRSRK